MIAEEHSFERKTDAPRDVRLAERYRVLQFAKKIASISVFTCSSV